MKKICQHCGEPFTAERAVRKYCSDSCRQLAFYKRSGMEQLSAEKEALSELTEENPLVINEEQGEQVYNSISVVKKESFNVKSNSGGYAGISETAIPINGEQAVSCLLPENNAIHAPALKSSVKNEPCPVNTATVLQPALPETKNSDYQWVRSRFNDAVMELSEDSETYLLFASPKHYWNIYDLERIKWVSLRLRCLLENLLRLCNEYTPVSLLAQLRDGFESIVTSREFSYLPANYPYTSLIKEMTGKLSAVTNGNKKHNAILLKFSRRSKTELIAARFMLAAIVPKARFSEIWCITDKKKEQAVKKNKADRF